MPPAFQTTNVGQAGVVHAGATLRQRSVVPWQSVGRTTTGPLRNDVTTYPISEAAPQLTVSGNNLSTAQSQSLLLCATLVLATIAYKFQSTIAQVTNRFKGNEASHLAVAATSGAMGRPTWQGMAGNSLKPIEAFVLVGVAVSLACVAGWINGCTLLGVLTQTPTHTTGITTKAAIGWITGNTKELIVGVGLFGSFMAGAFTAGLLAVGDVWKLGKRYGMLLLIEAAALFYGFYIYSTANQWYSMMLNAFACGIQNAISTKYSGAAARTTHLTGAATDMGTALAEVVKFGDKAPNAWRLKFLIPITLGYFFGGAGAAIAWGSMGYQAILIPAAFVGMLGLAYCGLLMWNENKNSGASYARA